MKIVISNAEISLKHDEENKIENKKEKIEMERKLVKFGVLTAVEFGTGYITGAALNTLVNTAGQNVAVKAAVYAAKLALAGVAAKATSKYAEETIDLAYEMIDTVKYEVQQQ